MKKASLIFALFVASCYSEDLRYAKLTFHATPENRYFIFAVENGFYKGSRDSSNEFNSSKMSNKEYIILKHLLKDKKYCTKKFSNPKFEIMSRQERIYDATFSRLIAESYNSKPLSPVYYYGKCL